MSSMIPKQHCTETTDITAAYTETTVTCADAVNGLDYHDAWTPNPMCTHDST